MKYYFIAGGPFFMTILSLVFILMGVWIIFHLVRGLVLANVNKDGVLRMLGYGRSIGLIALILGILFQLINLFDMFNQIQEIGGVNTGLISGGIKISMIATIYGIIIYLASIILWFVSCMLIEIKPSR